jgi:acyl-CoA thioester hydrolase
MTSTGAEQSLTIPGTPLIHSLRVRYHECDAQGHVFNATHFTYFDITLVELWRAAFGSYEAMLADNNDVVVADAQATFLRSVRFDDQLEIYFSISKLGRTSMVSEIEERVRGEVVVRGRMVHVFVDPRTMQKKEIPPDVRDRLAPWFSKAAR